LFVQEAKQHGCRNILALRGDPPAGQDEWTSTEGGFVHGIDLVQHIHRHYGDYFDIAVAGFPQHQLLPQEEFDLELGYLKEKVDAGCNFIFTQMFYDVDIFIKWVKAVRAAGITIPIVPGIAPIQNWNGFQRATSLAQIKIPQSFLDALEPHKNNDEVVREIGTKLVADMCRTILGAGLGIHGLHFYTMNLEKGTKMLLEELNLVPRVETIKPLPWRQVSALLTVKKSKCLTLFFAKSLTPNRRNETIRPIFWANRTKSYISRTENWDEYPNGRFGDSRSPAYGELDGYGVWIKQTVRIIVLIFSHILPQLTCALLYDQQKDAALKLWGEPATFAEVTSLFARFCTNQLAALPWSDQAPAGETSVIASRLAKLNELGFLTINSQPAVDGAPSDDPLFGWGHPNGYVYQKVGILRDTIFFC
jgi:methylenetetrahydrofolate reductase (NADPH)